MNDLIKNAAFVNASDVDNTISHNFPYISQERLRNAKNKMEVSFGDAAVTLVSTKEYFAAICASDCGFSWECAFDFLQMFPSTPKFVNLES